MSLLRSGFDTYMLYSIVKRLAAPFTEWEAYRLGVIDERGNFLIDKKNRTPEQYRSLTYYDIFIMNLKKLLQKIPGANNRYVTYAAALWLLREDRHEKMKMLSEDGTPVPSGIPTNTVTNGGEGLYDMDHKRSPIVVHKKNQIRHKEDVTKAPLLKR